MNGRHLTVVGALALLLSFGMAMSACSTSQERPPMKTVDYVDLDRFMGDWYVIASIPTFAEKDAYNAVESYRRLPDGRIATTFSFRKGGFDGKPKTMTPTGFVQDTQTNALWGMQFIWPIKADYRIVHLDAAYTETVIGREKRDYVWIMARTPTIADTDYARLVAIVAGLGYDTGKLQRVPQQAVELRQVPAGR
jgi:apolipoprotein D and lipocalin family protein